MLNRITNVNWIIGTCKEKSKNKIKDIKYKSNKFLKYKILFFKNTQKTLIKIKQKPIKPNSPKNSAKSECACIV